MFESMISVVAVAKYRKQETLRNLMPKRYLHGPKMEGHAKKCVGRYCKLANKTFEQLFKVATPCMDDRQFREEENGFVGE